MVLYGFKTIKAGEQAIIWNHRGEAAKVNGPKRLTLYRSRVEFLRCYHATQDQYLDIRMISGERVIIPGPTAMCVDPTMHSSIEAKDCTFIDGSEALVIYRIPDGQEAEKVKMVNEGDSGTIPTDDSGVIRRVI